MRRGFRAGLAKTRVNNKNQPGGFLGFIGVYYNKIKTLPVRFYKKNSDVCTKNRYQFLKTQ
jgi:hypothetical protein